MRIAKLIAYIGAEVSDFKQGMKTAEESLKQTGDKMTSFGAIIAAGVSAKLLELGRSAFDAAVKFDSLQRSLTVTTGSATEANRQLAELQQLARLPGLGFEQAVEGSRNLQLLGVSFKNSEAIMAGFGTAIARGGGGIQDFQAIMVNLRQNLNLLKLDGDQLKEFQARIPEFGKALQQAFGTQNVAELQKAGKTVRDIIGGVTQQFLKMNADANSAQNRLDNAADNIQAAFRSVGATLLQTLLPVIQRVSDGIVGMTAIFNSLPESTRQWVVGIGLAVIAIPPLIVAIGALINVAGAVAGAFGTLVAVMTGPVALGIAAMVAGSALLYAAWNSNFGGIRQIVGGALTFIGEKLTEFYGFLTKLPGVGDYIKKAGDAVGGAYNYVAGKIGGGIDYVKAQYMSLSKTFNDAVTAANSAAKVPAFDMAGFLKGAPKGAPDDKEAKKAAKEAAKGYDAARDYVDGLRRALYDLNNTGKVAEVMYERQYGALKSLGDAYDGQKKKLFELGLERARQIDAAEKERLAAKALEEQQKLYAATLAGLEERLRAGGELNAIQQMQMRLTTGDLAKLTEAQKQHIASLTAQTEAITQSNAAMKAQSEYLQQLRDQLGEAQGDGSKLGSVLNDIFSGKTSGTGFFDKTMMAQQIDQANAMKDGVKDGNREYEKQESIIQRINNSLNADVLKARARLTKGYNDEQEAFVSRFSDDLAKLHPFNAEAARDAIIDSYKAIAEYNGRLEMTKELEKERLAAVRDFQRSVGGAFEDSFYKVFKNLNSGFAGFFKALEQSFIELLARMAAKLLASQVMRFLGGQFGLDAGGGAKGGAGAGVGSAIGSIIGSIIPGVGTVVGGAVGSIFGGLFGGRSQQMPSGGSSVAVNYYGDMIVNDRADINRVSQETATRMAAAFASRTI